MSGPPPKKLSKAEARQQRKEVRRSSAAPEPIDDKYFEWSAGDLDHAYAGEWDWNLTPAETAQLLAILEDLAGKTWREVRQLNAKGHRRHHPQPLGSLCQAAQKRLEELELNLEELFRLRHGSTLRIWGHLVGPVFRIVWYDRNHRVYPTEPNS